MLAPFLSLAMRAPARQSAFRRAAVAHLLFVYAAAAALLAMLTPAVYQLFAYGLLGAGIVEGAVLVGWRLTQLPKSQALEFLLVSPLQPRRVFLAEALVGLARLALVTAAGLPVLLLLVGRGRLDPLDPLCSPVMPFAWGADRRPGADGVGVRAARVRRLGELPGLLGILPTWWSACWPGRSLRTGSEVPRRWASLFPAGSSPPPHAQPVRHGALVRPRGRSSRCGPRAGNLSPGAGSAWCWSCSPAGGPPEGALPRPALPADRHLRAGQRQAASASGRCRGGRSGG